MSSVFHENLDEQSPLLTGPSIHLPTLIPQTTGTSSTTGISSSPPTAPTPVQADPTPDTMSSPTPPPPESDLKPTANIITNITANGANHTPVTPTPKLPKASTNAPWGAPAGLQLRGPNDDMLLIFRRAVGINSDLSTAPSPTLEAGRKRPVGVYADVLRTKRRKAVWFQCLNSLLWLSYFFQVVVGAALTALGPGSSDHPNVITGLGVLNTVIAGFLALVKGQGLPERLRKDEMEFRRLEDWIEETEALLAVGVIGRDRKEVGLLVEMAFKRYNAAMASEENNRPDSYVPQTVEGGMPGVGSAQGFSNGGTVASSAPR